MKAKERILDLIIEEDLYDHLEDKFGFDLMKSFCDWIYNNFTKKDFDYTELEDLNEMCVDDRLFMISVVCYYLEA